MLNGLPKNGFKVVKFHRDHMLRLRTISEATGKTTFPDITDKSVITRCSVEDDKGEIIGGGFIKMIAESTIYVDPTLPLYKRARIVDELFRVGQIMAREKGIRELHAYLFDMRSFGNYLRKKLGFKPIPAEVYSLKVI
jgi:hypothetical protein